MSKPIAIALSALILAGCAGFDAAEGVIEARVDEGVDRLIERICKGHIDIAVRTLKRHPSLIHAAFEECPDTYGFLRDMILSEFVRKGSK